MLRAGTLVSLVSVVAVLLAAACSDSERTPSGFDQPIRVHGAVWKPGKLPGAAALSLEEEDEDSGVRVEPTLDVSDNPSVIVRPQQANKSIRGRTSGDAYSIALRFKDLGTGYWVKPVDSGDPLYPDTLDFSVAIDFAPDVPFGYHTLELVAIDGHGRAGRKEEIDLCAAPSFDKLINACEPTSLPPAAVLSLTWDGLSDLDLVVKTPSGKTVNAWHPATLVNDDKLVPLDPSTPGLGYLLGDSNAACDIDGLGREDLVWTGSPESGRYEIYVNQFHACGQAATRFEVQAYVRTRGKKAGTYAVGKLGDATQGVLLSPSANGGKTDGLYVGSIEFP